jgi:hypothetical protein
VSELGTEPTSYRYQLRAALRDRKRSVDRSTNHAGPELSLCISGSYFVAAFNLAASVAL